MGSRVHFQMLIDLFTANLTVSLVKWAASHLKIPQMNY